MKMLRLYQSDKGIWRYEVERYGKVSWSSLHTRDERVARATYERIKARIAPPGEGLVSSDRVTGD